MLRFFISRFNDFLNPSLHCRIQSAQILLCSWQFPADRQTIGFNDFSIKAGILLWGIGQFPVYSLRAISTRELSHPRSSPSLTIFKLNTFLSPSAKRMQPAKRYNRGKGLRLALQKGNRRRCRRRCQALAGSAEAPAAATVAPSGSGSVRAAAGARSDHCTTRCSLF